jgi:hypothetical protein
MGALTPSDADEATIVLKRVSALASRSKTKPLVAASAAGALYLLRVIDACAAADVANQAAVVAPAGEVVTGMLNDFFTRKDCRLPATFLEQAVQRCDWLPPLVLPAVLPLVQSARSDFLRVAAATLVATTLRHLATQQNGGGKEGGKKEKGKKEGGKEGGKGAKGAGREWLRDLVADTVGGVESLVGGVGPKKPAHAADAIKAVCTILDTLPKALGKGKDLKAVIGADDHAGLVHRLEAAYKLPATPKLITQQQRLQVMLGAKKRPPGVVEAVVPAEASKKKRKTTEDDEKEEEEEEGEEAEGFDDISDDDSEDDGKKKKAKKGKQGAQKMMIMITSLFGQPSADDDNELVWPS